MAVLDALLWLIFSVQRLGCVFFSSNWLLHDVERCVCEGFLEQQNKSKYYFLDLPRIVVLPLPHQLAWLNEGNGILLRTIF